MNDRAILEHRIVTLEGLLAAGSPLTGGSDEIARQLARRWAVERRLLQRLLADTPGEAVQPTLQAWLRRTVQFIHQSNQERPHWTDRQGTRWDAHEVVELLLDIQERLESWSEPPPADLDLDAAEESKP